MRRLTLKTLGSVLGCVVIAYVAFGAFHYFKVQKIYCESAQDGVWSPVRGVCITTTCFKDNSCGLRAYPAGWCEKLRIGDHISRVYVYLGEPMAANAAKAIWAWDKVSHGIGVEARFINDRLIGLHCPALLFSLENQAPPH